MPVESLTLGPRIQTYPDWDRPRLLARLGEIVAELSSLQRDYYRMQADETRTKADAFIGSMEQTIAGKTRDVELATYHITSSILEVRGEVEALREERNFIILLLGGNNAAAI